MGDSRLRVRQSPSVDVVHPAHGASSSRQPENSRYSISPEHHGSSIIRRQANGTKHPGPRIGGLQNIPNHHNSSPVLHYHENRSTPHYNSRSLAVSPSRSPYAGDRWTGEERHLNSQDRFPREPPRPASSLSAPSDRHPSVPPPQRPSSSHLLSRSPSISGVPLSPPSSRGHYHASLRRATPPGADRMDRHRVFDSDHRGLHSPPATRRLDERAALSENIRVPPYETTYRRNRALSQTSNHSNTEDVDRISRSPSSASDQGDELDPSSPRGNVSSEHAGSTPALQRPKRTRVLMTHVQQHRLGVLWKQVNFCLVDQGKPLCIVNVPQSKFPTTQEREEIASEVGLTPRQVQVWFQVGWKDPAIYEY